MSEETDYNAAVQEKLKLIQDLSAEDMARQFLDALSANVLNVERDKQGALAQIYAQIAQAEIIRDGLRELAASVKDLSASVKKANR